MKSINNLKQVHGQVIKQEPDILEEIFGTQRNKTCSASKDQIEKMSLPELKAVAEELSIIPTDNKSVLLKAIKKALK